MRSQIIEPQIIIFNHDDSMQDGMEDLELNPPLELFDDALQWDANQPSSGSMMKFSAPFPPLSQHDYSQKQYSHEQYSSDHYHR